MSRFQLFFFQCQLSRWLGFVKPWTMDPWITHIGVHRLSSQLRTICATISTAKAATQFSAGLTKTPLPFSQYTKKNENNPMANSMLSQSKKPPTRLATLQVFFLPHQPLAKHFPHHPTPSTPKSIHVTLNDKSWHRRIAKKWFHPPPVHAGSAHRKKYKKATSSFLSSDRMPLLAHLWKLRTTSSGHIQKYVANFAALTMFTICCTRSSAMWTCLQAGYPTSL